MFTRRTFFLTAILLGLLSFFQFSTNAQDNHSRYLIMENQLVFQRVNQLPYEFLHPMCWNESEGWCDEGMEDPGHRLFYLIDFETERHGVVMQNDTGCWIWWFRPNYGTDNNPHIEDHSWISCPA